MATQEQEDELLVKNAKEFLEYARSKERELREQLNEAIDRTKRAKEKYTTVFLECEERARRRAQDAIDRRLC